MFNLVGKRYLFLIISLIVIVPGTVSLLFKGLNVGIDFQGGGNIELRPSRPFTTVAQVQNLLNPLKLSDQQITLGNNATLPGNQTVWVRLNTQIDKNVQNTITDNLKKKYGSQLTVTFDDLTIGKTTVTVATVTKFGSNVTPQVSDIESLLRKLPNTTDVNKQSVSISATPTVNATATAAKGTPRATPTVQATATAQATTTATPTVGPGTATPVVSPTATATPTTNPAANIPVKVTDVQQGTTTQVVTILTRSEAGQPLVLKIKSQVLSDGNLYMQDLQTASVSASVASETTRNAVLAVLAASVLILLYIWFSFRKVARPWRYGTCAIIALLHDVLVVLGVFSVLGWLLNIQIDALFITALLTVVGFSVHDTIVVFDRIRENMQRRTSETFEQVVNASLVQTMARSLNTSLTVLFTLSALTLFGGTSIRNFTLTLLVGIFSGTYSSIFNASMLLVIWEKGELGLNRFRRGGGRTPGEREARELARVR